jgi:hypothetical protein
LAQENMKKIKVLLTEHGSGLWLRTGYSQ